MKKGGWLMKKGYILWLLISVISLPVVAQNIIYSNLKELMAQDGDHLFHIKPHVRFNSAAFSFHDLKCRPSRSRNFLLCFACL